jgi:hypothetical protein
VGLWPNEPVRLTFQTGSTIYAYTQFFLPNNQNVTVREGVDCTPTFDPNVSIQEKHTETRTATGVWHEMLIPLEPTVGSFADVLASNQKCNAWAQCLSAGVWSSTGMGDAAGGSCIVSRFEVAGYLDVCGLDQADIEFDVDDCPTCTMGDTMFGSWREGVPGVVDGNTTKWRFPGKSLFAACKAVRQFNPTIVPGTEWLIQDQWTQDPVTQTWSSAVAINKRARWRFIDKSGRQISSVEVGCGMTEPNVEGAGHTGQIRIETGRVVPAGTSTWPCVGP